MIFSASHSARFSAAAGALCVAAGLFWAGESRAQSPAPTSFALVGWGRESLEQVDKDFWMSPRRLYAQEFKADMKRGEADRRTPAFMWDCGVQLSALAAAAKMDRSRYAGRLRQFATGLDAYWQQPADGPGGYDVLPVPKGLDRYYDDNAWIVLGMIEAYEVTGDKEFLRRAEKTMEFVLSGEDDKLGGGLYWREAEKRSKNTCTNAPAIVAALKLYQITKNDHYLQAARRVYRWLCDTLQDSDGLFWDHMGLGGNIGRFKLTYNSALMIRANVEVYRITKDPKYLREAERIGDAAIGKWVTPEGGIRDSGRFAHLLLRSFIELAGVSPDPRWRATVDRCVAFVHDHLRDANGRYPEHWDRAPAKPIAKSPLLDQASVACAYWEAAAPFVRPAPRLSVTPAAATR